MPDEYPDWFEALGNEVPESHRKLAWRKAVTEMGVKEEHTKSDVKGWVEDMAEKIEDDDPEAAIAIGRGVLDMTGAYRVLAYLCVGPRKPDHETAWKDLVQRFGGMLDGVEKAAGQGSLRASQDADVLENVREIIDEVAVAHNVEEVWELPPGYDPTMEDDDAQ